MRTPFTQVYIQTQIDYYAEQMKVATASQKYSFVEGPVGQFGVEKGDLNKIQKALDYWLELMEKYYPDAFAPSKTAIKFYEIGMGDG